jgi:hypothetical protein
VFLEILCLALVTIAALQILTSCLIATTSGSRPTRVLEGRVIHLRHARRSWTSRHQYVNVEVTFFCLGSVGLSQRAGELLTPTSPEEISAFRCRPWPELVHSKSQVQAVLARILLPRWPFTDLFGIKGRRWLGDQSLLISAEPSPPSSDSCRCGCWPSPGSRRH